MDFIWRFLIINRFLNKCYFLFFIYFSQYTKTFDAVKTGVFFRIFKKQYLTSTIFRELFVFFDMHKKTHTVVELNNERKSKNKNIIFN